MADCDQTSRCCFFWTEIWSVWLAKLGKWEPCCKSSGSSGSSSSRGCWVYMYRGRLKKTKKHINSSVCLAILQNPNHTDRQKQLSSKMFFLITILWTEQNWLFRLLTKVRQFLWIAMECILLWIFQPPFCGFLSVNSQKCVICLT